MDLSNYNFHCRPGVWNTETGSFIVGITPMIQYTPELLEEVNQEYDRRLEENRKLREQISTKTWTVASNRDPNTFYTVTQHVDGSWECTCKGFQYRRSCSHIEGIKNNAQ